MTKLYALDSSFIHDAEPKDGFVIDMVRASDYVELEKRSAELEKQRDELIELHHDQLCRLLPPGCQYMDPPDGGSVEPIAQVRRMINALVAENAALKDINAWCKTEAFSNMYREFKTAEALGCLDEDCMHDAMLVAIMHSPGTPATDAAIAELGAKAVDTFCSELGAHYQNLKPSSVMAKAIKWSVMQGVNYSNKLRGGGV